MAARKASTLAAYAVGVILLTVALRALLELLTGTSAFIVVVEGNSMVPTLWSGDIVFTVRVPPDEIRVGDIIVFRALEGGHLVIHRVVEVNVIGGRYYYVTKGDNNLFPDNIVPRIQTRYGIPYENVEGVVAGVWLGGQKYPVRVPLLGYVSIALAGLKQVLGDLLNPQPRLGPAR